VYTGEFFKDPSPDSEPSVDDSYCGFGASDKTEEVSSFGIPVKVQTVHTAQSDYWDIPPVKCVFIITLSLLSLSL